jgi:hypothetical protein
MLESTLDITRKQSANEAGAVFDQQKWQTKLSELSSAYQSHFPFPHIVLDDFLNPAIAIQAARQFPAVASSEWIEYRHFNTKKLGQNKREIIPRIHLQIIDELNSDVFVSFLRELTGIPNLVADQSLEGGGLHQITKDGFLNIHADFTSHIKQTHWARRVNLLFYLNENWQEEYGGHLELWDRQMERCRTKILPILNRCVIFNTNFDTFHGHPEPLTCPEDTTRKSIALYYFTEEQAQPVARSTEYRSRPQDSRLKRLFIFLDKSLLRIYDQGRRKLGISDQFVSKILRWFR